MLRISSSNFFIALIVSIDGSSSSVNDTRHTCLRNGVPIYTVQRWMRHSSVQTTQNYADLLNSDVGEQVGKVIGNQIAIAIY